MPTSASAAAPVGQAPAPRGPEGRRPRSRVRGAVLGSLLLAVVVLRSVVATQETTQAQQRLADQLVAAAPVRHPVDGVVPVARAVASGRALATLAVPRFGTEWSWVVAEGASVAQLDQGPGHAPGSALPGARGAVVITGHRSGHGAPFSAVGELRRGDDVSLDQYGLRWTYRLLGGPRLVLADAPLVGRPGPRRELVLATGWPSHASNRRLVVRGVLVGIAAAPPAAP